MLIPCVVLVEEGRTCMRLVASSGNFSPDSLLVQVSDSRPQLEKSVHGASYLQRIQIPPADAKRTLARLLNCYFNVLSHTRSPKHPQPFTSTPLNPRP